VQSFEYGDIGNAEQHGQRVRAGSSRYLGSNGGIVAGDSYPASSPEKHSTDPQFQTLPERVWQGTIARYSNGVVIVPMIWESDGQRGILGNYQNLELEFTPFTFSRMIKDPARTDQTDVGFAIRNDFDRLRPLEHRLAPGDKPIGYHGASFDDGLRFKAQALFLTYDEALRLSNLHRSTGKAYPITYTSVPDAGGGSSPFGSRSSTVLGLSYSVPHCRPKKRHTQGVCSLIKTRCLSLCFGGGRGNLGGAFKFCGSGGINADEFAATSLVLKFYKTFDQREQRVVLAAADVVAGLPLGAALTRQDITPEYMLPARFL
jgi:hypothetical protein